MLCIGSLGLLRDRRDDRPQLSLYTLDHLVLEASGTAEQNRAISS